MERHSARLNLTVDKSTVWVHIPPRFIHWAHDQVCFFAKSAHNHKNTLAFLYEKKTKIICFLSAQMSVGTNHSFGSQRSARAHGGFHGCLENLYYNGLNLIDLAKRKVQQVTLMVMSSDLCGCNYVIELVAQKQSSFILQQPNCVYVDVQIVILAFESVYTQRNIQSPRCTE